MSGMVSEFWQDKAESISRRIDSCKISGFKDWPDIQSTMVVGEADHVKKKLDWLLLNMPHYIEIVEDGNYNQANQAYHLARFEEATGIKSNKLDMIVEFGGGFGELAYLIHKLGS